jgi:hypothetical protein
VRVSERLHDNGKLIKIYVLLYRMKTNRRSKRVKKTRRNRRSRRTQGGGGKFGQIRKTHESNLQGCRLKCDTDNPDPILNHYSKQKATPSGWYIENPWTGQGIGYNYEIKNDSLGITISSYPSGEQYTDYLDMLYELPDPTKIYTTGSMFKNDIWKLTYDTEKRQLKWVELDSKTQQPKQQPKQQPFVIKSPLTIGDKEAKEQT